MMIHIFIGTKAQYVKTAPVIRELDRRGVSYNLIDSGQHAALSKSYRDYFAIRDPDCFLSSGNEDIKSVGKFLTWSLTILFKILFLPVWVFRDVFKGQGGVCLIHGDTPTTLLSVLAAKRVGIKVAHLESGLRSYNLFHPFPEEMIRIITMRLSDYLFAPSPWALENLEKMKIRGSKFLICGNTNIDALMYARDRQVTLPEEFFAKKKFVVFSIHRAETILNRARLFRIVELVRRVAMRYMVFFCVHPPTQKQLQKYRFDVLLRETPGVQLRDLLAYPMFIEAIKRAHFIVTDGGSVQEESYFLNIPCLLMRNRTERMEGVHSNVLVSEFKDEKIDYFLDNVESFRNSDYREIQQSPSAQIVDILCEGRL